MRRGKMDKEVAQTLSHFGLLISVRIASVVQAFNQIVDVALCIVHTFCMNILFNAGSEEECKEAPLTLGERT